MLLNPKTILSRNALSNVLVNPIYAVDDLIGSGFDKIAGKRTGVRTTGIADYKSQKKGWRKGAYESYDDFRKHINTRDIKDDRYDRTEVEAFGNGVFTDRATEKGLFNTIDKGLGNALNALDRTTSFLLDVGDRPFFEGYFLESLNNQIKLNKVSEPTSEMIEVANQVALEKTWQDKKQFYNRLRKALEGL